MIMIGSVLIRNKLYGQLGLIAVEGLFLVRPFATRGAAGRLNNRQRSRHFNLPRYWDESWFGRGGEGYHSLVRRLATTGAGDWINELIWLIGTPLRVMLGEMEQFLVTSKIKSSSSNVDGLDVNQSSLTPTKVMTWSKRRPWNEVKPEWDRSRPTWRKKLIKDAGKYWSIQCWLSQWLNPITVTLRTWAHEL